MSTHEIVVRLVAFAAVSPVVWPAAAWLTDRLNKRDAS